MALQRRLYNLLYSEYRRSVSHSPKGVPMVPFGTWLYRFALLLLSVAPQYKIDEAPTEGQIQGFQIILRSYALFLSESGGDIDAGVEG